jgi:hypothetical protein
MSNTTQSGAAQSAVAVAVQMIGDRPAVELQETIFQIGTETLDAETLMQKGKAALDVLDSNLHDIIKGLPYVQFMLVRDYHKAGAVDKGKSDDAAQKIWERQVNRICSVFEFKKPKSESADAVRKAEKKAEEIGKLGEHSDGELLEMKQSLISKGDQKSLREALKLGKEVERRNADAISSETEARKMMVSKIITRAKELGKAGTEDADALLGKVLLMLG